jgi:signal transduction histidine kinase
MRTGTLPVLTDPYRRLWVFLVVLIVAILVTAFGILGYFHRHLLHRAGESLAIVAADTTSDIDRLLSERQGDSHMMARAFSSQMENPKYLNEYLAWVHESYSPFYHWLEVTDVNGRVIAATDKTRIGHQGPAWNPPVSQDRALLIQDVVSPLDGSSSPALVLTLAISDPRGRLAGFVTSLINVPALAAIVKHTEKPVTRILELSEELKYLFVGSNGAILVSLPAEDDTQIPAIEKLTRPPSPSYKVDSWFQTDVPMVMGYAATEGFGNFTDPGWLVVILAPQKALLGPMWTLSGLLFLTATGVLVPLFATLFATARRLQERDVELHDKQGRLAALAAQLSLTEERERKRLATALHDNLAQLLTLTKMKLQFEELPRAKEYVDQALTYTRQLLVELTPPLLGDKTDLQAAVRWVVQKMERHGLQVEVRDEAGPLTLSEELLTVSYQTIQELLFNVLKHAGTKKASVCLERSATTLIITVADQGHGFDGSRGMPRSQEGGFGLLNIQERLELLGGSLAMSSMPGQGTRATVTLPFGHPQGEHHPIAHLTREEQLAQSAREPSSLIRVAIIDDHRMVRDGLRHIIEAQKDMTVVAEADNGHDGMEMVKRVEPNVVLMDVNMPILNGIEATRHLAPVSTSLHHWAVDSR